MHTNFLKRFAISLNKELTQSTPGAAAKVRQMIESKYKAVAAVAIGLLSAVANARAQQMTVAQQEGQSLERSSYAHQSMARSEDTMAQVDVARFQLELADRAAKRADEIKQAAIAAREAQEARDADLEKEIERCLQAGLPVPTEATWVKPTAYEQERAKFHDSMREQMNARVHREYSNPTTMALPSTDSDQTIRDFLATRGYKNLSQADIDGVRALLMRHGLHHISQLED
jgi:hypothetical protein